MLRGECLIRCSNQAGSLETLDLSSSPATYCLYGLEQVTSSLWASFSSGEAQTTLELRWNSVCGLQGWQIMYVDCGFGGAGSHPSTATGQVLHLLNLNVPICTMGIMIPISQRCVLCQWESSIPFSLNYLMSLSFLSTQWALPGHTK